MGDKGRCGVKDAKRFIKDSREESGRAGST
jgi:hypothetical protein